jgi:hypothetical protein
MAKAIKKTIEPEHIERKPRFSVKKILIIIIIVGLILGLASGGAYFFLKYQSQKNMVAGAQDTQELDKVVEKVGKLIELPQKEQAALATVSDITKLKDQPFFINARNGDKVLIYEQSKKAILYRPESNKVIEVGPINIQQPQVEQTGQSQNQENKVMVAIYNGTTTTGLTRRAEGELLALSSLQVEVVAKENASSSAYSESLVIDLKGGNADKAKQLATVIKGKVASLPTGETGPLDADILIILGSTFVSQE